MIKKSKINDEYIVYNPHNFKLHTHTRHKRIAIIIKNNVEHHRIPKTTDLRLLYSHIRVTKNKNYIRQIEERIACLTGKSVGMETPA
ncbi:MAG: hypothetical protein ACRCW1_10730 [Anaerotignaceae bacterium]